MKIVKKHLILFVIIFIQIFIIILWGNRKENLYWDEYFTFERAHYISSSTPSEHYIDTDSAYEISKWLSISIIKDTLTVTKSISVVNDSLMKSIKRLVGYHGYSVLLNLSELVISPGRLSIWPAIVLNIFLLILNQLLLFRLCRKLHSDEWFSYAVVALYGFTGLCISMTIFIRFYMFVTLLCTVFTYFQCSFYYEKRVIKQCIYMFISLGTLFIAFNNAPYAAIYGAFFIFVFSFLLLIERKFEKFLCYAIPVYGGGLIYLAKKTDYLRIIFDFNGVLEDSTGAFNGALEQIAYFKLSYLPERFLEMLHKFGRYLFGSFFVMLLFILCFIIAMIVRMARKRKVEKQSHMLYVIIVTMVIYITFFTVFMLYGEIRYISYVFPELAIVVITMAYSMFDNKKYTYMTISALLVLLVLSTNIKGKVDFIYPGDRAVIEKTRETGYDSMIIYANGHRTDISYQAAYLASDDMDFYVYDSGLDNALQNLKDSLRDQMIILKYSGVSSEDVEVMLAEQGYSVEWIGDLYRYNVLKATKN